MATERHFEPIAVVGRSEDQSPASLAAQIDAWLVSEPLDALVAEFGGAIPAADPLSQLDYLDEFSQRWDFRALARSGGRAAERNQALAYDFSEEVAALIRGAVRALGLVEPNFPQYDAYSHVLVNGAMVRFSMWRTAYAGHLLRGGLTTRTVSSLTAYRAMATSPRNPDADEPTLLRRYGLPPVADEAQLMEHLLCAEFGLDAMTGEGARVPADADARFAVRSARKDGVDFALVVAPDPSSRERARTADTMRFWAAEVAELQPGDRVLSISSSIYGPYQHAAAIETLGLPYGALIDTVAIDFDAIPEQPARYEHTLSQYLQEVRSTIRAYRDLLQALPDPR